MHDVHYICIKFIPMKFVIRFLALIFLFLVFSGKTNASPGDTIKVQTFTFGSPQDAWFLFPSDTVQLNKILMYYTLKCNPAQNPPCGEWDYQTSTYLYEHTGILDSNLLNTPSFKIDGNSPDSVKFMFSPSWKYYPRFNTSVIYDSVISFDSTQVGNGNNISSECFNTVHPEGRAQYLWKVQELLSSGMLAGNISGLRFFIDNLGAELKNLTIRIKHSSLDSLNVDSFENDGFLTVFSNNYSFINLGWNKILFTQNFVWDGIQNIIIDFSFDNKFTGAANQIMTHNTGYKSGIVSSGSDKSLFFFGADYIEVPKEAFAGIDSFATVTFWAYGNPLYQPQNQSIFSAFDSLNNRVLNVHLPWSNSNIYWDAGNNCSSSYDRINKSASNSEIEGQWNYWAFAKNAITGNQKIYLNGNLWHSGTGLTRKLCEIRKFRIGSMQNQFSENYDGFINEFAIWDKELDAATIKKWMYKDINNQHPDYNKLKLYYKFDDNCNDSSIANHNGTMFGPPTYQYVKGSEIVRNFTESSYRPNLIFEQGSYISQLDTVITIDSTANEPFQIYFFNDSLNPLVCQDTLTVWPDFYNHYQYNQYGTATDSTYVQPDSTIYLNKWYYYSNPFEKINRYELGRFITPYGNGLNLGNGFTWVYDVSDFRPLLKDSVHLSAGNWQELLDLRFELIQGTPPREVQSVKKLWSGNYNYGYPNDPIENKLKPIKVFIPSGTNYVRLKSCITGHGMDSPQNCAEFCPKNHYFLVNGVQKHQRLVWRDDCGLNPLYPQGGTWIYNRSNWCPGAEVKPYDLEMSDFITPGDTVLFDHDVEPYLHTSGWSYYQIEDHLIFYGPANFANDAELYDIIRPNEAQMFLRKNPICNNPLVVIRNTGYETLNTLDITYGVEGVGTQPSVFNWTGNLKFMETAQVELEHVNWTGSNGSFYATVSNPNGQADQYNPNNTGYAKYISTSEYPADLVIEFKTNLYPSENHYILKDDLGNIVLQKDIFSANTLYRDTVHLSNGCYDFTLYDADDDGLSFWANNDGTGYIRIKNALTGQYIKVFNGDFGSQAWVQFTVGYNLNAVKYEESDIIEIYPNPAYEMITVEMILSKNQNIEIEIFDMMGNKISNRMFPNILESLISLDVSKLKAGIYFVNVKKENGIINRKIIIQK